MANKNFNREGIMKLCQDIKKKDGEGAVFSLGSKNGVLNIKRWSTGLPDLDAIIGGGMPEGRTIELFGAESAGKTSLAYHLCSQHEMCLDIPIEGCVDCDTEFFNGREWKRIADYKEGERVLQYNKDGTAELVLPLKYHKKETNVFYHLFYDDCDMCLSLNHNIVYSDNNGKIKRVMLSQTDLLNTEGISANQINIPSSFDSCYPFGKKDKKIKLSKCKMKIEESKDGYMYCFTMPSKMWVMRRNDKIIVTGNTFDSDRAKQFGNTPKQMIVYRAQYGEKAFNRTIRFAEEGIPLVVIDSVPSLQPKDDIDKIRKAVNTDSEQETRIGGVARLMDKYLPTLEAVIEQTGTTVIFINQIRDKMNALPFGDNIQTPGGHKLKHSASLRIQVARKGDITIPNYNPMNTADKEVVGIIMKCKVVKSKVCNPKGQCEIPLFFDKGFVDFADLDEVRKEVMAEHKKYYKELYS